MGIYIYGAKLAPKQQKHIWNFIYFQYVQEKADISTASIS